MEGLHMRVMNGVSLATKVQQSCTCAQSAAKLYLYSNTVQIQFSSAAHGCTSQVDVNFSFRGNKLLAEKFTSTGLRSLSHRANLLRKQWRFSDSLHNDENGRWAARGVKSHLEQTMLFFSHNACLYYWCNMISQIRPQSASCF